MGSFSPWQSFPIPLTHVLRRLEMETGSAQEGQHKGLKTHDKGLKAVDTGNDDKQVPRCNAAVLAAAIITMEVQETFFTSVARTV